MLIVASATPRRRRRRRLRRHRHTTLSAMDQLPEWDASKADDPQFLANIAKHACGMSVLKRRAHGRT